MTDPKTLADRIEDLLPQTQCTKCGYQGCRPYAEAIAQGDANYNQCPPGGAQGIARLAALLGKPVIPLNPVNGVERPRPVALIDENLCIGCTLCMQACPVDAIVGAAKQMHTMVAELCTGCDLCVPPCPVDCIAMIPVTGSATGWDAWSQPQADAARERYHRRGARLEREREASEARAAARRSATSGTAADSGEAHADASAAGGTAGVASAPATANAPHHGAGTPPSANVSADADADADADAKKRAVIQAALERARKKKEELAAKGQGPQNTANVDADVQAQIDAAEARRRRLGIGGDPGQPAAGGAPSAQAARDAGRPSPSHAANERTDAQHRTNADRKGHSDHSDHGDHGDHGDDGSSNATHSASDHSNPKR
ncbi:electron transport complex subunit RsxB [Paraburkholderia solisilvae]|uniref:Ion-translocating oxidoreductase complex subunit B n=1 Tax=Paraburkholderia solisilvae TaxID=624376 RepID=A0A6J5EGH9_9BURK|nr:electron transport complex subunit RsxB [Paraburkholderia solisilvae]CAB3764824.1 Ion-translocating oxidoreductase complex subunit B [Paraburkholderia solisilvae]